MEEDRVGVGVDKGYGDVEGVAVSHLFGDIDAHDDCELGVDCYKLDLSMG